MLNIRCDIPLKEEVADRIQSELAQIRDRTLEVEQLLNAAIKEKVLMKREEVAEFLRCDPRKIPRQIPNMRVGRNWLYDRDDVYKFLESKKVVRKQC